MDEKLENHGRYIFESRFGTSFRLICALGLLFLCNMLCSFQNNEEVITVSNAQRSKSERGKSQGSSLSHDIDRIIHSADPNVHAGIEIVSLKNTEKLFQKNENQLFVPASSLKILTAAAALHILGV